MFVNSKLIKEELLFQDLNIPTAAASVSSTVLVDSSKGTKHMFDIHLGQTTTAGNVVVTVWESTASVWASAVATEITAARTTVSRTTSQVGSFQVELQDGDISKPYLGVHVSKASDPSSVVIATLVRGGLRFGNM